jgi:hypothetical protein
MLCCGYSNDYHSLLLIQILSHICHTEINVQLYCEQTVLKQMPDTKTFFTTLTNETFFICATIKIFLRQKLPITKKQDNFTWRHVWWCSWYFFRKVETRLQQLRFQVPHFFTFFSSFTTDLAMLGPSRFFSIILIPKLPDVFVFCDDHHSFQ